MTMPNKGLAKIIRAVLADDFPLCFAGHGEDKRPLAVTVGLELALMKPELSRIGIAAALDDYCGGPTYLRNVIAGAERIGLDGQPDGVVTANHAAFAAHKMKLFANAQARISSAKAAAE